MTMKTNNKKEILRAALNEFSTKSYDNASVNEIIEKSNASKGTFYHYFADKRTLYLDLIKEAIETKWDFINSHIKEENDKIEENDIFHTLFEQAKIGVQFAKLFPQYFALSNNFLLEAGKPIYYEVNQELGINQSRKLRKLIQTTYQKGQIDNYYLLDFVEKLLLFLFNHFGDIFSYRDSSLDQILANVKQMVRLLKIGLGKSTDITY